jgi:hypothetical protein
MSGVLGLETFRCEAAVHTALQPRPEPDRTGISPSLRRCCEPKRSEPPRHYGRHWETYAIASAPESVPTTSATTAISSQRESALAKQNRICRVGQSGSPPMTANSTPDVLAAARTRALNPSNSSPGSRSSCVSPTLPCVGSPSSSPTRIMMSVGSAGAVCLSSANRRACSLCVSRSSQPRLCASKAAKRASISTSSRLRR